jgi:Uma2 family endonuclease
MQAAKILTIDDFVLFSEKLQGHGLFEFIDNRIVPVQSTEPLDEAFVEKILDPAFDTQHLSLSFPVATQKHDKIISNLHFHLRLALRNKGYSVYSQGTDILANGESYKPDIVVVREEEEVREKHHILNPLLVMEVLSKSTQSKDRAEKLDNYQTIPELMAYLMVSQQEKKVWIYERIDAYTWQERILTSTSQAIELIQPALSLRLEDVYEGIL